MMTHKEALRVAKMRPYGDIEAFLRAYIEARGLVLVPKEPTQEMISAACDVWGSRVDEAVYGNITGEIKVAIAAAPDPFGDE